MYSASDSRRSLRNRILTVVVLIVATVAFLGFFLKGRTDKELVTFGDLPEEPIVSDDLSPMTATSVGKGEFSSAFRFRALVLSNTNLQVIRRMAEAGDAVAMIVLAWRYEIGQGIAIDYFEADTWYTKALGQGSPEAASCLDRFHARLSTIGSGDRVYTDCLLLSELWQPIRQEELAGYYGQAAESGDPAAMLKLSYALTSKEGGDLELAQAEEWQQKAIHVYNKLAAKGDPDAMLHLAEILLTQLPSEGASYLRDEAQGIQWCKKAVEAESSEAMLLLADLYSDGRGVEQNHPSAFALVQRAAEGGNSRAMCRLATMFETGQFIPRDEIAATQWFQRAARVGDVTALLWIGQKLLAGKGEGEDKAAAIECFLRAIRLGDDSGEAAFQVARALVNGPGGDFNETSAVEFLRHAAQRNHPEALFQLSQHFERGIGVERDANQAEILILRAASLGHHEAQLALTNAEVVAGGAEQSLERAENGKAEADAAEIVAESSKIPLKNIETATSWGSLVAPPGDASATLEEDQLRLTFNKLLHRSDPLGNGGLADGANAGTIMNGPRIEQEVSGDFSVAITFSGPFAWERTHQAERITSSPPLGVASLLIWEDQLNFVRVDRVCSLEGDELRYTCFVRMFQDGQQVHQSSKVLEAPTVRVRLQRSGNRIRGSMTVDGGQSWTSFRSQIITLPKVVNVGISAFSDAAGPISADFRELELDRNP